MTELWIRPEWPAPPNVHAIITTRTGGVSSGPYGAADGSGGMNIGRASGDRAEHVEANRARLRNALPAEPRWLHQVHGADVVDATHVNADVTADASFTDAANVVCVVSVADCMPVLLTDTSGRCVAVAHAGWRGLAAGVIQATVRAVRDRLRAPNAELIAYLGPAIGPRHFEVGSEVLQAMESSLPDAERSFEAQGGGKYLADLFQLARQALELVGVRRTFGGYDCTFSDPLRFYSYRRDRITGRHAAAIWRV